ncbi:PTS sugar transporter subunit IIA [Niallia sp. 03133]|uniref:PTS sugar transporter subunit IIA n=1 Tax=Niallia sp. 03133 TaxID=3458060 RepID=UPI004043BA04
MDETIIAASSLFQNLFSDKLVFTKFEADSKDALFKKISELLEEKKYVKPSFFQGLLEREKNFPTGLRTKSFHVAIPHTDPEHIITPFIAVIKPNKPICFYEMGSDDIDVQAQIIFVLGLYKSEEQVPLLQCLMEMFMEEKTMEHLIASDDVKEILSFIQKQMK